MILQEQQTSSTFQLSDGFNLATNVAYEMVGILCGVALFCGLALIKIRGLFETVRLHLEEQNQLAIKQLTQSPRSLQEPDGKSDELIRIFNQTSFNGKKRENSGNINAIESL